MMGLRLVYTWECKKCKPPAGFEPATFRLQGGCSTTKLKWLSVDLALRRSLIRNHTPAKRKRTLPTSRREITLEGINPFSI